MYESFYGLKEKPFTLLPDPEYLYLSPKHQRALTLLEYGMMNQAGFSVICGDTGAGKTTLIRRLLAELEDDTTVGLINNTHQSFGELLSWVLMAFGIDGEGKSKTQMHQLFIEFLVEQYARNRHTVLIVDEAQNMDTNTLEQLRMLSNINADKDQVLQVILAGQPALRETLRKPELMQFAQRIAVDYYLESLNRDETMAYILHRLEVAGADREIFTPAACDTIYKYSGGTPRLINLLCDTSLVYGFAEQTSLIDAPLVEDVVREQHAHSIVPTFNIPDDENTQQQSVSSVNLEQPPTPRAKQQEHPDDHTAVDPAQDELDTVIAELGQRARQMVSNFDSATRAVPREMGDSRQEKGEETWAGPSRTEAARESNVTPINQDVSLNEMADDSSAATESGGRKTVSQDEDHGQDPHHEHQQTSPGQAHFQDTEQATQNNENTDIPNDELAEEDVVYEPADTTVSAHHYSPSHNTHRPYYENMYPIVQVESATRKNTSYLILGIAGGMFAASLVMVIAGYFMFTQGPNTVQQPAAIQVSPTDSPVMADTQRQQDIEKARLEAIEKERDAALAMTRALERERDAALSAARAQEEMRAAERRAAELVAQQERRTAEEVRRAREQARQAGIAAAKARERERLAREQAERAKIENERIRMAREQAMTKQTISEQTVLKDPETAEQVQAAQAAAETSLESPVEQPGVGTPTQEQTATKFSTNPCNSPSAKFLSTCKK